MSFLTDWYNNFTDRIAEAVAARVLTDSGRTIAQARAYRMGRQPPQLKVRQGQYDDNLTLNYLGLIVDRCVSQMVGGGVDFHFDEAGESENAEYIEDVWDANHIESLLHRAVMCACEAGTGYIQIVPGEAGENGEPLSGMIGEDGRVYPRLVLVDPAYVTMETAREDFEVVTRYTIQYKLVNEDEQRRRVIEQDADTGRWTIVDFIANLKTGGKFEEVGRFEWPWDFCPMIHWQNLPSIDSPYGEPDITADLIDLQDKLNGVISWLNKALRLEVSPLRYGVNLGDTSSMQVGPDKILSLGPDGTISQLPPATDWAGAMALFAALKRDMFAISRTVDLGSMEDKLGALTNFALRTIYQDNAAKIDTKRELLGDALEEINRRLQIMAGMEPLDCEVIWQDFIPVNMQENLQAIQAALTAGLISKQTAYEAVRAALGVTGDWEAERERITAEEQADYEATPEL